jgi:hypothetical protein
VGFRNFSLFIVPTLDFGQIWEGNGVCGDFYGASVPPIDIYSRKALQSRGGETVGPGPVAGRCNQMDVKMAKELLVNFRLFESFSIPRKRRIRRMKRFSSSSDLVSQV